jgi:exopolysaccharide biosynthesis protein
MLVMQGQPVDGLDDSELDPRTAIGINRNARWLYIVVVDGRQPFYRTVPPYTWRNPD